MTADSGKDIPTRRIAIIAGDGVGREVVPVALEVARTAARDDLQLETVEFPRGCDFYLESGAMIARTRRSRPT